MSLSERFTVDQIIIYMYRLVLNQYTLRSLINYVMIIILSFMLIIILAIINYFINKNKKSDQLQPIDYNEFKNQLLGKCEICHKQYKRKDIVKKDGHQYCKYCIKEEDS